MSKYHKDFWNDRYSPEEFVYGEAPNEYLKDKLSALSPGTIVLPAEGEGRNAVYAAKNGWTISAFDQSEAGQKKAILLAERSSVSIDYRVSDMDTIDYPGQSFDTLALIYAHFPADVRREYHQKLSSYLKKGGALILEAFAKEHTKNQQVNPDAGGPCDINALYDLAEIQADFEGYEYKEALTAVIELSEGSHHLGKADVIRIFAIKK